MAELKCPKCGEVFSIDEASYDSIALQVRDKEFEKELDRREKAAERALRAEFETARQKAQAGSDAEIEKLKAEIERLRLSAESDTQKALATQSEKFNAEARELKDKLAEQERRSAELSAQLKSAEQVMDANAEAAAAKARAEMRDTLGEKDSEIAALKAKMQADAEQVDDRIQRAESDADSRVDQVRREYALQLKAKDDEIAFYRDFKARESTKMIGESLEQHCLTVFNQNRPLMSGDIYFEKDNDARTGSKGDFIFRENLDGVEILSIMFEMKNEADTTASKHKNEDFFRELDKDRREKSCEYAVLVTMLEPDNDLYNTGIVDVSHRYPKMYVIRPQFFMILISILRNAARAGADSRIELDRIKKQDVDFANFENNMNAFKSGFQKNYNLASKHFDTAISEIDKSIEHLQKVRDALTGSSRQLRLASDKVDGLSVKRVTKDAPMTRIAIESAARNVLPGSDPEPDPDQASVSEPVVEPVPEPAAGPGPDVPEITADRSIDWGGDILGLRVDHAVCGRGAITGASNGRVTIRFDNGESKIFAIDMLRGRNLVMRET